jgi:hypothetical protein
VTKTSGCDGCNDAGAITQQRITAGDGYAQFTAGANGPLRSAGLTQSFAGLSPGSIAFGVRFQGNFAEVREGGVYRADTPFAPGDVFRIAVQSGVVRYSKNGTVFYSSAATPGYPLVLAAALANRGATVGGAVITGAASSTSTSSSSTSSTPSAPSAPSVSSGTGSTAPSAIVWTNPINVTASGGSVSKTSGCDGCYDAGAVSQQQISGGNGYVQFTAGPTGSLRVAGLTASFSANNPNSIAFGLRLQSGIAEVAKPAPTARTSRSRPGRLPHQRSGRRGELLEKRNGVLQEQRRLEQRARAGRLDRQHERRHRQRASRQRQLATPAPGASPSGGAPGSSFAPFRMSV